MSVRCPDLSGSRVLLVQRSDRLAALIADVVLNAGASVVVRASGASEVLAMEEPASADIVLIDENAGISNTGALAGSFSGPQTPVLLMANRPTRALVSSAAEQGFHIVIAKPFSVRSLCAHVERCRIAGSHAAAAALDVQLAD